MFRLFRPVIRSSKFNQSSRMFSASSLPKPQGVLQFWFEEVTAQQRFEKDDKFDDLVRTEFLPLHEALTTKELVWEDTPLNRLAHIIVFDQFSRNMFRDTPESFASDPAALSLAQGAVEKGYHNQLTGEQNMFLFMPYMHSEDLAVHDAVVPLFESLQGTFSHADQVLLFAHKHRDIIKRFGRYPHRNEILNRTSTQEEIEFLKEDGSSF